MHLLYLNCTKTGILTGNAADMDLILPFLQSVSGALSRAINFTGILRDILRKIPFFHKEHMKSVLFLGITYTKLEIYPVK